MNNYQLYRTNPKLGGQVAWNIILGSVNGNLEATDFNLSPYSPFTNFTYNEDRDWLRYSHQENVVHLYKQTKGFFYDPCIDSRLSGHYPLLDKINTKNTVEDYGISRIPYKRYNKQFSILCPVWLEEFGPDNDLEFEFVIRPEPKKTNEVAIGFPEDNEGNEIVLSKKVFSLKLDDDSITDKHRALKKYFDSYIDYISQDYNNGRFIGDDIINIDIRNDSDSVTEFGSVTGLHVASGNIVTKDITSFIPNLYDRERPMMETDSLIQSNISNNELIVRQLFNFNFIFNLEDLSNATMLKLIGDSNKLNVDVRVRINGELLERRVFDSNYIYIPNDQVSNVSSMGRGIDEMLQVEKRKNNVFRYLLDPTCIDLIKYNKVSQYIHHWSLTDNNDYIFNLYRGFAALNKRVPSYFYKLAPNYWETDSNRYPNALLWCKHIYFDRVRDFESNIMNYLSNSKHYTIIDGSSHFVDYTKINPYRDDSDKAIRVSTISIAATPIVIHDSLNNVFGNTASQIGIFCKIKGVNQFTDTGNTGEGSDLDPNEAIRGEDVVFIMRAFADNSIILISSDYTSKTLTYKYVKENIIPTVLNYFVHHASYKPFYYKSFNELSKFFHNVVEPGFIFIRNSLNYRRVDSPINTSNEIEYTKDNNSSSTLIRYLGAIKPTFAKLENVIEFQFRYYSDLDNKDQRVFDTGIKQKYLPYYPSIRFWYLNPIHTRGEESRFNRNDVDCIVEDKWYDYSIILNIAPLISFSVESKLHDDGIYYKLEELVRDKIREIYPNIEADDKTYAYFLSLYNISSSFEYAEENGRPQFHDKDKKKFKYIYNVKLTLK